MKAHNEIIPENGRAILIDASLNKYNGKVLFQKKVKAAKDILSQSPVPKHLR